MIKRLATAALVLLGWAHAAGAAEPHKIGDGDGHGALQTEDGLLVAWNSSAAHFTLELKGRDIRVLELDDLGFSMDGYVIQLFAVDPARFAPQDTAAPEILARHMTFETDHWSQSLGATLSSAVRPTDTPLPSGMQLWEIRLTPEARAKAGGTLTKALFLTAIIGDRALVASHPLWEGEDEAAAYAYLERVARSLRAQSTRIDVQALQESLRSGNAPKKTTVAP